MAVASASHVSVSPVATVGKVAGAAMPVETGIQREISAKVDEFVKTFVETRADGGEVRSFGYGCCELR